jgi:hypothetical protein
VNDQPAKETRRSDFKLPRRTVELQRQTFELTEQGQVNDRYTKFACVSKVRGPTIGWCQ